MSPRRHLGHRLPSSDLTSCFWLFCRGAQIKTRKRNIAVPLDPGSFADAVVAIFQDVKDGDDVEKNLIAAVKVRGQ